MRLTLLLTTASLFLSSSLLAESAPAKAPAPAAGTIELRYKAVKPGPVFYESEVVSQNTITTTTGTSSHKYTTKKTLARHAAAGATGTLSVDLIENGFTMELDGQPAANREPDSPSHARVSITSTGEIAAGALELKGASGGVELVLPQKPVKIGDSWEFTAPERPEFPVPLKTVFTLKGLKQSEGRTFAIIATSAELDKQLPERHVAIVVKHAGTAAFDVEGGYLNQLSAKTSFKIKYLAKNIANFVETENETQNKLKAFTKPPK